MKTICAWCSRMLGDDTNPDGVLSHGICPECKEYFFPEHGPRSFVEFLDQLAVPVIVVDDNYRLVAANEPARRMVGISARKIKGMRLGQAIECPFARLPEGCGRSVHCRSCAVRLTVQDTHSTGLGHYGVPAYKDKSFTKNDRTISLLISTEKLGDFVLLRLHEIGEKERMHF